MRASSPSPGGAPAARTAGVVSGLLALLYVVLAPLHLLVLTGAARPVMALLAGASAVAMAALWLRWRVRPPSPTRVELLAVVPLVNSLTHIGMTGEIEQTTVLMLVVVAIGAGVTARRTAVALGGGAGVGWLSLVPSMPVDQRAQAGHYAIQLAMAALLAVLLHEARRRREQALHHARDELAEQVRVAGAAQAELAASEQRFRTAFVDSPVGIALCDEDDRFVAANAALCRLLGRSESEVVGYDGATFSHPEDVHAHLRARRGDDAGAAVQVEKRYLRPDGEVRWAWLTVTRIDGPDGRPWTLGHVQDVTARKAAEQALSDSEGNLAAVSAVVRSIRTGGDARSTIVEAARRIADAASVSLLERDGDHDLVVTTATGLDLKGVRVSLDRLSATAHVWGTGEPLFLADPAGSALADPHLLQLAQARSALWQPVVTRGVVTAVLAVTWSHRLPDLSDRAARAVALLADETSVALEHDALLGDYARMAGTDQLTGLPNRRAWDEQLPLLMQGAQATGGPLLVAIADLDHFKAYNDLFGHVQGDQLLRATAARLRAQLRGGDLVARWGGEEFAIALPGCELSAAQDVLTRLCSSLLEGQTCSIGYAVYDGSESCDRVLERADRALYDAKTAGRNRAVAALVP